VNANKIDKSELTPVQEAVIGTIGLLVWLAWFGVAVLAAFAPEKIDAVCPWAGSTFRWPFVLGSVGCLIYGWLTVMEEVLGWKPPEKKPTPPEKRTLPAGPPRANGQ
jgi:hypothetical protein